MNTGIRRVAALLVSGILAVVLLVMVQSANSEPLPPDAFDYSMIDFTETPEDIASNIFHANIVYDAPSLPAASSPITLPDTVWRIGVVTDSLYSLSYEELALAGLPVTGTSPADFHLSWRGQAVSLDGIGVDDASFDAGDSLIFFGEAFHGTLQEEKYTSENVYWLSVDDSTAGSFMSSRDVTPTTFTATGICTTMDGINENKLYSRRNMLYPGLDTTWFYDPIPYNQGNGITTTLQTTYSSSVNLKVTAHDLAPAPEAVLELELAPKDTIQHEMMLVMDNINLGEWQWSGKESKVVTVTLPSGVLNAGNNTVTVYFSGDFVRRTFYLDRLEISYLQEPTAESGIWLCDSPSTGAQDFSVTNLDGSALLYDVSTTLEPVKLTGYSVDAAGLHFSDTLASETRYLAMMPQSLSAADVIETSPDLDLIDPATGADEIIIAPQQFHSALQPLITHRESQGLRVRLVDIQDAYALFNGGVIHPEAIRSLAAWAYNNWPGDAPAYLFLVGDGNYNMHGYNPALYGDFVPTLIPPYLFFDDPNLGEIPVDARYGDVVYDQYGQPEIAVGRLPANSVTEVEKYVEKVLRYENLPDDFSAWSNHIILAGDNGETSPELFETYLTMLDANVIPDAVHGIPIYMTEICGYPSSTECPEATELLLEAWDAGALMLVYSGHGAIYRWANEPLMVSTTDGSDFDRLTTNDTLPVLLSLDCWDGYWMYPTSYPQSGTRDTHGIAEYVTSVLTETGTIGAFSPAGLGYSSQEYQLAKAFMDHYFIDGERRLGDLAEAGRAPIATTYMGRIYTLFGDPATELHDYTPTQVYMPLTVK